MQSDTDQPEPYAVPSNDQAPYYRRTTVQEAAKLLGISPEAVRARVRRGTLQKDKAPDGTVFVLLDDNQTRSNGDGSSDRLGVNSGDQTRLVISLEEQVSFLRAELVTRNEELRRKDHIIAALTERIPELEAPREPAAEPREAREKSSEEPDKGQGNNPEQQNPSQHRSWWRAFFGLE